MRNKKKLFIFALTLATLTLVACGKDDDTSTSESTMAPTTEVTTTVAPTNEAPTTVAPTTVATPTEVETKDATQEWIDKIYNCIVAGDWENAYKTAGTIDNIQKICAQYQDKDWSMDFAPYEYAYLMTTSEGKHLGIVLYRFLDCVDKATNNEVNIFVSENKERNYGLESTGYNDIGMSFKIYKDGKIEIDRTYINNHLKCYDNGYEDDIEPDEGINAWHA